LQQVQDWITAWRADDENGAAEDTVAAPASATAFKQPAMVDAPLRKAAAEPAAPATATPVAEGYSRVATQTATAQAAPVEESGENLTNYQVQSSGVCTPELLSVADRSPNCCQAP
jgi:hypothetical protein